MPPPALRSALATILMIYATYATAQSVKIVGLGASTCGEYLADTEANAASQREYVSWAQGYMSGLLVRAPPGVDEELDLTPATFPLIRQVEYLANFCRARPELGFPDAVQELYKALRRPR